jgi:glycosyltransferase involved in cell wall biosynthesis
MGRPFHIGFIPELTLPSHPELFCDTIKGALKILLYTDLTIRPNQLFWHRDLGLLTRAFRELGHDAWLVVHPAHPTADRFPSDSKGEPVLWASPNEVRQPLWWKKEKPDIVILGLWTRPKYDAVRRAALASTSRVIERADSDGMRTASCGLKTYFQRRFDYFRDRTYPWPALLSIPLSLLYALVSILVTPWVERRLAKTLRLIPAMAVETPSATLFWKVLATKLKADPTRIHCIPHPIQTDIFRTEASLPKKNQMISVGRWNSYQKAYSRLEGFLLGFLDANPDWTALVVGPGLPARSLHPRMVFLPRLPPMELSKEMQSSTIFCTSSRYESFGMAAIEAACCGCTILGPGSLGVFSYFPTGTSLPMGMKGSLPRGWEAFSLAELRSSNLPQGNRSFFSKENVASLFLQALNQQLP